MYPIEGHAGPETDLRHYGRVVWRRKWLIVVLCGAVTAAVYFNSSAQTPVYRATAEMLIRPRISETIFDQSAGFLYYSPQAIETEIEVLSSQPVAERVAEALGYSGSVSADQVRQTDVVSVSSTSTDPERAAAIANAYVRAYIDFRREQAVADLGAAVEQVQAKIDELQARIDANDALLDDPQLSDADEASIEVERDSLLSQQSVFRQQLNQLQVDQSLRTGGAELVRPATPPSAPFEPTPVEDALTALAATLLLALAIAFVRDHLDDSVRTQDDVAKAASDLPVLGIIPAIRGWRRKDRAVLVSADDPTSAAAEAYRSLRTSIQFLGIDRPLQTVQFTSPSASEGKTTTVANLAVALSRAGQRVVVVCCDLRRPRIHQFFGLSNEVGFTSVLLGDVALSEAVQAVPGHDGLQLLASGPPPPNPAELLTSMRTMEVLTALQATADVVLIDTPPTLPVTDAAVMSGRVDATLVVATARRTTRKQLARAVEVLRQVDAPLVGAVLNGVKGEGAYGYSYGYRYYGREQGRSRKRRKDAVASR